jgi:tyrosinase
MATFTLVRAFRLLLVLSLLCSSTESTIVRAHRRRHTVTNLHSHIRRQDDIYPVLGVREHGLNNTAPRLEIRELQRNPDLFNLYLLGLQRWQNTSQDEKLSYFQIAGMYASTQYEKLCCRLIIARYSWPAVHTLGWRSWTSTAGRGV